MKFVLFYFFLKNYLLFLSMIFALLMMRVYLFFFFLELKWLTQFGDEHSVIKKMHYKIMYSAWYWSNEIVLQNKGKRQICRNQISKPHIILLTVFQFIYFWCQEKYWIETFSPRSFTALGRGYTLIFQTREGCSPPHSTQ